MRTFTFLAVASLLCHNASANNFDDVEGPASSGLNDSTTTAQALGVLPIDVDSLTVDGVIDQSNPNDVDFYSFTVAGGPVGVYFDIDFAEDIDATDDDDFGLDAALAVFDAAGTLIALNDDSDFFEIGPEDNAGDDPGSDPFADHDPFIGELLLDDGGYFVAVHYFDNEPNAFNAQDAIDFVELFPSGEAVTDATPDASFGLDAECDDPSDPFNQCVGSYRLDIRTQFDEIATIPEPAASLLIVAGLILTTAGARR